MDKFKSNFWWQLKRGGNKLRRINISVLLPPSMYDKYIGDYNNHNFGGKELKITGNKIYTTKSCNGYCPYSFVKFLFNINGSLSTTFQNNQTSLHERVRIFNPNIQYSTNTNVLHFTSDVSWSVNNGKTWQKLKDTR